MNRQIRIGAIIAYINIALNLLVNIFLTPFLISSLGEAEYGVYKIIQSFSAQLSIISFGISTLVTRNVVYYNTLGLSHKEDKENFLFTARIISYILVGIIICIGVGLYLSIDALYSSTMSIDELRTAKKLFVVFVANVAVTILCDPNYGLVRAHEKFVIANGLNTVRVVLRVIVIAVLVNAKAGSIGIVLTDLFLSLLIWLLLLVYCRSGLHEKAKYHHLDYKMIRQSLTFATAIFLQAIINQVNQNLDNVILGAMVSPSAVTVYSCGLTLYTSYLSLITVIGSMYGPKATQMVAQEATGRQLTDFIVTPARIQAMIAGLTISGFILFGKNFIELWLGEGFMDVYIITLILIIPAVLSLMDSVTVNILDAMMKRMARSLILIAMCVFNIVTSIVLIKLVGYVGAAIGTALSVVIGNGILMNVYLHKKIHIDVPYMLSGIFKKTVPACIVSIIVGIPITLLPNTFVWFCIKVIVFVSIYIVIMYKIGMNDKEQTSVKSLVGRIIH